MKVCSKCGVKKAQEDFSKSGSKYRADCKSCCREAMVAWRTRNRTALLKKKREDYYKNHNKSKEDVRNWRKQLKSKVLSFYGYSCVCCGETSEEFLTVDHVNGGGTQHRKHRGPHGVYLDIINSSFPADYRILCMNCNFATRYGQTCPHQISKEKIV